MITIAMEDPKQPVVMTYLAELDAFNDALYPPEANHHLDIESLRQPAISFFVARDETGAAVGIGALRHCPATAHEPAYGEIKRMYVPPHQRGRGIARRLIEHVQQVAKHDGHAMLRLETGTASEAALRTYERVGFARCPAFGDYPDHPLSVFMEKRLTGA